MRGPLDAGKLTLPHPVDGVAAASNAPATCPQINSHQIMRMTVGNVGGSSLLLTQGTLGTPGECPCCLHHSVKGCCCP